MMRRIRPLAATALAVVALVVFSMAPALGQTSAGYRMTEHAFNDGGRPAAGLIATSPGFRLTVDSIGGSLRGTALSSPSFRMRLGIVPETNAPGEVHNLRFLDRTTMVWDPDPSAGVYNVYRADSVTLPVSFGSCYQPGLAATQAGDPAQPPPGIGWFYFVTAENGLSEEGTKGFSSSGAERSNTAPCP
jgi:hypothetical protein